MQNFYTPTYKVEGSVLVSLVCLSVCPSICLSFLFLAPTQKPFNPFPNKPWFLRVCITRLLKTLREKKKFFSHSVFCPFEELPFIFIKFGIVVCKLFQFGLVQNLLFGKGLTLEQETLHKSCPWPMQYPIVFGSYETKVKIAGEGCLKMVSIF